jgi:hypothetical protein
VQVLKVCAEAGLVKVGVVALDGTKVKGIMKTRTGYVQGYNGQVLVSELQVIVADSRGERLPSATSDRGAGSGCGLLE